MLKIAILVSLALVAIATPHQHIVEKEWQEFKAKYNKEYSSLEEEIERRETFLENYLRIITHNRDAANGKKSYRMGVNEFADMTNEEFRQRNGYRGVRKPAPQVFSSQVEDEMLAETVDWRKKGLVTKVKNQGQCGSCWSFSAVASLEGQHAKATGNLVSLSEQNLMDCSTSYGNLGCKGGLMDQAFKYIRDNKGVDTEESYPYEGVNDECRFKRKDVGATLKSYVDIPEGSEKDLKKATATIGPISVAIDAGLDSFQLYKSGVYDDSDCSSEDLDHGVTVVGYGTEDGKDYWLVKNSWGADWGEEGYIRMSRNKDNQCGIASKASYPVV